MTETIRAFLALELADEVKIRLEEATTRVRRTLPPARWTRREGWHLTLKFLGDCSAGTLGQLTAGLAGRLRGLGPVTVRLAGGGFFPSPTRPRVAWLGGSAPGVDRVVAMVETTAVEIGFEADQRPWAVHLTMARMKRRWPRHAVERYLAWAEALEPETMDFREVILFRSRLEPGGAVYTALERFSLE